MMNLAAYTLKPPSSVAAVVVGALCLVRACMDGWITPTPAWPLPCSTNPSTHPP